MYSATVTYIHIVNKNERDGNYKYKQTNKISSFEVRSGVFVDY